jgi:hypothetical protein
VELCGDRTAYTGNSDGCNRRGCSGRYRNDETIVDAVMAGRHRAIKHMPELPVVAPHFFVKDASSMRSVSRAAHSCAARHTSGRAAG